MAHDQDAKRYPLAFTQEWFVTLDQDEDGGTFSRRFVLVRPLRITGLVDLAVLQGALDDVVARHELLRTVVVRDADPPYQQGSRRARYRSRSGTCPRSSASTSLAGTEP